MKRLCALSELTQGKGLEVMVDGQAVMLLLGSAGPCAFINSCPHQGRSLNFAPGEFLFTPAGQLVCPHHGATFDVSSGLCTDGPCQGSSLTALATECHEGTVFAAE